MTQDSIQQLEDKHTGKKWEEIKTTRLKGQCMQSKAHWIDQGETNKNFR